MAGKRCTVLCRTATLNSLLRQLRNRARRAGNCFVEIAYDSERRQNEEGQCRGLKRTPALGPANPTTVVWELSGIHRRRLYLLLSGGC